MNLLLDTNIFIDYLGRKKPFFSDAQKIVMAAFFGDARLWVASQSVVDAFYVLQRFIDPVRLQKAIVQALKLITPVDLTANDLVQATSLSWPDMEDCLIALAANKAHAQYLITRDTKGFERSSVPIIAPAEWLELMRQEKGLGYDEIDL